MVKDGGMIYGQEKFYYFFTIEAQRRREIMFIQPEIQRLPVCFQQSRF